ncbi:nucleotidyl transferase family protein [Marinisporobacter balticus]|uniref:Nicotinic acid mononucleotide adenylyltransferase n=1 Tax=Marinisporobacter balticus TaxID=2018667 RepID=A0A4V2SCI0_9FIRM|nr:cytidyltransferase [Marinisporobacter balticus]TCO79390.1 nicotinic acid mononucleotide adenylyltransferase [Marinisporobacter balticus]
MENLIVIELYNKIYNTFLNPNWLEKLSLNETFIKKHIEGLSFLNGIEDILTRNDYSCHATLHLCENILNTLAKENVPKDWLYYLYQFTLQKSFPHAVEISLDPNLDSACYLYLDLLRILSEFQKSSKDNTWQSQYPLAFLSQEEIKDLENPIEYKQFLTAFYSDYVYEMMKLNHEVAGYNTIDHICGVHYLSLFIARQLKNCGLPIDLGRVSGATAGHDIGKYGCTNEEQHRVPYLHYYYTDLWFSNHKIVYIRHIALNHSVWDLELENLSLESLILIYSDFRVKNFMDNSGHIKMHIYNLSDSFAVILEKLDNVDQTKKNRYARVYEKLKDFENYMLHLGVYVDVSIPLNAHFVEKKAHKPHYALIQGKEIVNHIKHLSFHHNVHLMYLLRDEYALENILQLARSEKDWTNFREYLRIFEEYSTYMTQKQKRITINFLYENLIHPEDDIRKHCAALMGALIALFDEVYRKELPKNAILSPTSITSRDLFEKYLKLFIFSDPKIIPKHRKWIGYSLSTMITSLFNHCTLTENNQLKNQAHEYITLLLKYYDQNIYGKNDIAFYLLETLKHIPISICDARIDILFNFLFEMLKEKKHDLRIAALEATYILLPHMGAHKKFIKKITSSLTSENTPCKSASENFLKLKIIKELNLDPSIVTKYTDFFKIDKNIVSSMFLSNLKVATKPVIKKVQIEILLNHARNNPEISGLQTALHFCNLLKVSASDRTRTRAGEGVLEIISFLSFEQRNEVAVELLSALELDGYQFTEYIPPFLGQLILTLQPIELDEIIDDFIEKLNQSNAILSGLILKTIGVAIANYSKYLTIFHEGENKYDVRLIKMLGVLLKGLVHAHVRVKQVAFTVIGKGIFGETNLQIEEKNKIFKLIAKKMLTLLTDHQDETLLFLGNAAALHHLYRFIANNLFLQGDPGSIPKKVAFFPGTFDPFSLIHKQIAKSVRDRGFEVYLAIDEFSWSKHTLPHLLRKDIANMSIADSLNIYLYPEDFPINIGNQRDLDTLKNMFPHSQVHMVMGSDVILNATSYQAEKNKGSIHTFPHIIFEKSDLLPVMKNNSALSSAIRQIDGQVTILSLPSPYDEISATQIRNYIDENRDLSSLIDPLAQKYIYGNGFYKRESQHKTLMEGISLKIETIKNFDINMIRDLCTSFYHDSSEAQKKIVGFFHKPSARLLIVRDMTQNGKIIGFSAHHWVRLNTLFYDLKESTVSEYIRDHSIGRIAMIDGIFVHPSSNHTNLEQILLTETLAFALSKDYEYAVFHNMIGEYSSSSLAETLTVQGFEQLPFGDQKNPIFTVKMNAPCTLNLDMKGIIKEPFRSNPKIVKAILASRKKLQKALTNLYPGNLILSFDRNVLYETLVQKICAVNSVPTTPLTPRKLGSAMCVPFGKILKQSIIPNTVTKSLHTEKLFLPHMKGFMIGAFPHYTDLEFQIKMLRSFNMPIILVDDILHKGYRNNVLSPLLNKENIKVEKTIVGILSARGKELMHRQNRKVDCAYYIPKLKAWFNENMLYPFFGGDTIWRGTTPQRNLVPSINVILPFTSPTFIKDASKASQYNFSKVCIQNALDILKVIETEYHYIHKRNLTLASLGEVFISPRCPDHGKNMHYDLNYSPSYYLENDLDLLNRLETTLLD